MNGRVVFKVGHMKPRFTFKTKHEIEIKFLIYLRPALISAVYNKLTVNGNKLRRNGKKIVNRVIQRRQS